MYPMACLWLTPVDQTTEPLWCVFTASPLSALPWFCLFFISGECFVGTLWQKHPCFQHVILSRRGKNIISRVFERRDLYGDCLCHIKPGKGAPAQQWQQSLSGGRTAFPGAPGVDGGNPARDLNSVPPPHPPPEFFLTHAPPLCATL